MQSFYLNQTKPTLCSPKQTFCAYEHMTSAPTEVIEKTVLQTKGLSCSYITWRKWHVFSRPSEKPELTSSDQRWGCSPWLCASLRRLSSVQFSRSVMSDSLRPHELQHARPPCPSPTLGVHPNSCPSSQWCHPSISSSVVSFSSCPQSLPASESFPMSQLFAWGGQSIGASALASVLPKNTQDWSPLEWTGWISLESKGLSRVFSNTTVQKHQFFSAQLSWQSNSHPYMTTGKTIALTRWTFVGKVTSLLLNMLSRLVITFLPRSKRLLISWLQ